MKTDRHVSRRLGGRALRECGLLQSSHYRLPWALGALATVSLIGATMATSVWKDAATKASVGAASATRIVLTANTTPPALWSNAWLGRRPYRAVAFHGLRRFATGFSLIMPHRPRTLGQEFMRVAPEISVRFVRFKDAVSSKVRRAFATESGF